MSIWEQTRRANSFPSLDIELEAGEDLSATQLLAARIEDLTAKTLSGSPSSPVYSGVQQNAPIEGAGARHRIIGLSEVIFGGTVAVGDRLRVDDSTGRYVTWDPATEGHSHTVTTLEVGHFVLASDLNGDPISGEAANIDTELVVDDGTDPAAAGETVTVAASSTPGYYRVSYTPTIGGFIYRLRVGLNYGGVDVFMTPSEFHDMPSALLGAIEPTSLMVLAGVALTAGVDGDTGLIIALQQVM